MEDKSRGALAFTDFYFVIPASHAVIPASHVVIPASHAVIPASHAVIPAKAGIQTVESPGSPSEIRYE